MAKRPPRRWKRARQSESAIISDKSSINGSMLYTVVSETGWRRLPSREPDRWILNPAFSLINSGGVMDRFLKDVDLGTFHGRLIFPSGT